MQSMQRNFVSENKKRSGSYQSGHHITIKKHSFICVPKFIKTKIVLLHFFNYYSKRRYLLSICQCLSIALTLPFDSLGVLCERDGILLLILQVSHVSQQGSLERSEE